LIDKLGKCPQKTEIYRIKSLFFSEMKCDDEMSSQVKDKNWRTDLAFPDDIMCNLNNFNIILQGKESLIHEPYATVKAFKM
jgi:hypothetical protein